MWETQKGAPLVLFAYPDENQEKNLFAIEIPKLASLINTHKLDGQLIGLKTVKKEDRPLVAPVFYSFRIMVGIGLLMVLIGIIGSVLVAKGSILKATRFLKVCVLCSPIGFIAMIAGWFTAEFGRQPWVVYGMLRTEYAVSDLSFIQVAISLSLIIIVYFVIFGFFYFRYCSRIIKQCPSEPGTERMPYAYFQSVEENISKKGD